MSEDKTRQGRYSFDGFGINRQDAGGYLPRLLTGNKNMSAEARTEFGQFCHAAIEAGAIQDETGLSPRQIVGQRDALRDELLEALKVVDAVVLVAEAHMDESARKRFAQDLKSRRLDDFDTRARAALKASERPPQGQRISQTPAVVAVFDALRAEGWEPFGFREEPEVRSPESLVTRRLVEGPMKRIRPQIGGPSAAQELDAASGAFSVYFVPPGGAPLETGELRGVHFSVRDGKVEIDGWHADFPAFGNAVMKVDDGMRGAGQADEQEKGRGQGR